MRNRTRVIPSLLLLLFGIMPESNGQQTNFLFPDPSTNKNEVLTNAAELPDGSLVFCGRQTSSQNSTTARDAVLLKTNGRGAVISKKVLQRPPYSNWDFPFEILALQEKTILLSVQDSVYTAPYLLGRNRICWRKLDTALNVISEKMLSVVPDYFDIISLTALQVADTTFVAFMVRGTGLGNERCALLTLDTAGGVIAFKYLDSAFFGWGTNASVEKVKSLERRPATFNRPGGVVVSCSGTLNQPVIGGTEKFLLQVDARLNLTDTFDLSSSLTSIPADTVLAPITFWEAIPLPGGNYITGSRLCFELLSGGGQKLLGTGRYNSTTHKFQTQGLVPANTYLGTDLRDILGRSLVRAGNYFYVFGYTYGLGFTNPENSWVVAQYNNNATLIRSRSFCATGYEYSAINIKALKNGGVMLMGGRNGLNLQSDYFAIRLDSAGRVLSLPGLVAPELVVNRFTVIPNPGTGQFTVTDAKGQMGEVSVWDIAGRFVCRQKWGGGSTGLDITGEPAGVYLFQVLGVDGVIKWLRAVLK